MPSISPSFLHPAAALSLALALVAVPSLAEARAQGTAPGVTAEKAAGPAPTAPASAATTDRFDGDWTIRIDCPANTEPSGAKGYRYDFPASVLDGRLFGSHGQQGAAGSLQVEGTIAPDGGARLQAHGRTASPDYAANKPPTGTAFSYDIEAHFEAREGTGKRLQQRACDFAFTRR